MRSKEEIEKAIEKELMPHRPPIEIRQQLDHCYEFDGREFIFSELRPVWNDPSRKMASPIARSVFVKSKGIWKNYWMRGNLKWYTYDPHPTSNSIEEVIDMVFKDEHHCFFG